MECYMWRYVFIWRGKFCVFRNIIHKGAQIATFWFRDREQNKVLIGRFHTQTPFWCLSQYYGLPMRMSNKLCNIPTFCRMLECCRLYFYDGIEHKRLSPVVSSYARVISPESFVKWISHAPDTRSEKMWPPNTERSFLPNVP